MGTRSDGGATKNAEHNKGREDIVYTDCTFGGGWADDAVHDKVLSAADIGEEPAGRILQIYKQITYR